MARAVYEMDQPEMDERVAAIRKEYASQSREILAKIFLGYKNEVLSLGVRISILEQFEKEIFAQLEKKL